MELKNLRLSVRCRVLGESMKVLNRWPAAGTFPAVTFSPAYKKALLYAFSFVIVAFAAMAVRFLFASRPSVGGVDFYYYILFARDLAGGATDVPQERYVYFPGVYTFWKTVIQLSDGGLPSLQWAFLGVLLVNGVLTGAILNSLTGYWQAGALAAGVYLVVASRIEGLAGITEPIATIPFLMGLWLWIALRGSKEIPFGLLALGAGFGLALFSKQQGGLLALGAIGLLPALQYTAPSTRSTIPQLLVVPVVACGVFLSAMWLEGGGLAAVKTGLLFATEYQAHGSWTEHVVRVFSVTQPISNLFLSGCVLWLVMWFTRKRLPIVSDVVMLTLGIAIFSVIGCLLQFSMRGYLHYALLLLPSAIITAGLAIYISTRFLSSYTASWPRFAAPSVLFGTIAFLLINSAGTTSLVKDAAARMASPTRGATQEEIGARFAPVCSRLQSGSELLLIPPRQKRVHWFCGTRSLALKVKSTWDETDPVKYLPVLSATKTQNVFLLSENYGPYEKRFWKQRDWSEFMREMDRLGFRQTYAFEAGRLYQKTSL